MDDDNDDDDSDDGDNNELEKAHQRIRVHNLDTLCEAFGKRSVWSVHSVINERVRLGNLQ